MLSPRTLLAALKEYPHGGVVADWIDALIAGKVVSSREINQHLGGISDIIEKQAGRGGGSIPNRAELRKDITNVLQDFAEAKNKAPIKFTAAQLQALEGRAGRPTKAGIKLSGQGTPITDASGKEILAEAENPNLYGSFEKAPAASKQYGKAKSQPADLVMTEDTGAGQTSFPVQVQGAGGKTFTGSRSSKVIKDVPGWEPDTAAMDELGVVPIRSGEGRYAVVRVPTRSEANAAGEVQQVKDWSRLQAQPVEPGRKVELQGGDPQEYVKYVAESQKREQQAADEAMSQVRAREANRPMGRRPQSVSPGMGQSVVKQANRAAMDPAIFDSRDAADQFLREIVEARKPTGAKLEQPFNIGQGQKTAQNLTDRLVEGSDPKLREGMAKAQARGDLPAGNLDDVLRELVMGSKSAGGREATSLGNPRGAGAVAQTEYGPATRSTVGRVEAGMSHPEDVVQAIGPGEGRQLSDRMPELGQRELINRERYQRVGQPVPAEITHGKPTELPGYIQDEPGEMVGGRLMPRARREVGPQMDPLRQDLDALLAELLGGARVAHPGQQRIF